VRCKISSDSRSDNVVGTAFVQKERDKEAIVSNERFSRGFAKMTKRDGNLPSNQDSHAGKHGEKSNRAQTVRRDSKDTKEDNQSAHENSNHDGTTSSENIRNVANNDTSRHHTNRVERGDEIGLHGVKVLSEKVRQPEEKDVVGKLEETKSKSVLRNHGDFECIHVRNGFGASVGCQDFSLFRHFLLLEFILGLTDAHFGRRDAHSGRVGNELKREEGPRNIGNGRNEKGPPVWEAGTENRGRTKGGSDITTVLVAGPESKDGSTVLDRLGITEPISHDGSSDGSSRGLEESKEKVDSDNEEVTKGDRHALKVEPEGNVDEQETSTRTKEADSEDGGRIEGIPKLSVDDVSGGISGHEDSVHLGQEECRVSTFRLQLLLHGRVTPANRIKERAWRKERNSEQSCIE
jgi:hypothetical protein